MRLLDPRGEIRLRIAAVGDVGVIGAVRARARARGFDSVFAALAPRFHEADLAFANLEFPVAEPAWVRPGRAAEFHHDAETVGALARAGVKVVSLANNHMMDYGVEGLKRTLQTCATAGVQTVGAGMDLERASRPARWTLRGMRVVMLGYAATGTDRSREDEPGVAPLDPERVAADLQRWRSEADLLVVSVHWGSMYVDYPPARVLELARSLAEGADLVLGHHPHVVQGASRTGRHLTVFSMGDICFDAKAGDFEASIASEKRRESGVFEVLWADEPGLDVWPLKLDDDGVPFASGAEQARAQAERLRRLSDGLIDAETRFREECAPKLLRYELESLVQHLRSGRLDRVARLLGGVRPRHLRTLWEAIRNLGRAA
jgi:hypothetical protein